MITIAKRFLEQGGVGAIPTETVYGLAANAFNTMAVAKIFDIKNRPTFDPLILHTDSISKIFDYTTDFPPLAQKLANHFWPGPLTLLLPKSALVPDLVTASLPNVAVRIPDHPIALQLLKSLAFPLAAPSANPFGYISPTTALHVEQQLGSKIDFILDGGACNVGIESTIVGFENQQPVIYRLGGISVEAIEELVGKCIIQTSGSNPKAPGMLMAHYAPKTPLIITDNINKYAIKYAHKKIGVISFSDFFYHVNIIESLVLSSSKDLKEAAASIFAFMRQLDCIEALDYILVEQMPEEGLGRAINDRLLRASAKRAFTKGI